MDPPSRGSKVILSLISPVYALGLRINIYIYLFDSRGNKRRTNDACECGDKKRDARSFGGIKGRRRLRKIKNKGVRLKEYIFLLAASTQPQRYNNLLDPAL